MSSLLYLKEANMFEVHVSKCNIYVNHKEQQPVSWEVNVFFLNNEFQGLFIAKKGISVPLNLLYLRA